MTHDAVSESEPAEDRGPAATDLTHMRDAHGTLMALYAALANHASQLGVFPVRRRFLVTGVLVRPFVQSHISKRLRQLSARYRWTEQEVSGANVDAGDRTWLAARPDELDELRETLSSWSGFGALAKWLWPPLGAALVLYLGGEDLWDALFSADLSKLGAIGVAVLFPAVYILLFCNASFEHKRALFLGGPKNPVKDEQQAPPESNVYAAEDRLWAALNMAKDRERPVDSMATTGGLLIFVALELGVALTGGGLLFAGFAAFFVVMAAISCRSERRRLYR
jgi:hypothetical protein